MSYLETLADICKIGTYLQPEGMSIRLFGILPEERIENLYFKKLSFAEVSRISSFIANKATEKTAFVSYATALLMATVYIKTTDGTFKGFDEKEREQLAKVLDEHLVKALVDEAERANYMWAYAKDKVIEQTGNS